MKIKFFISLFLIFISIEASSNETINIDLKFYSLNDVVMKRKNEYIYFAVLDVDFELGLFPRVKKATGSSQAVSEVLLLMKDFFVIYIFKNNRITILIFYKPENHLYTY